MNTLTFNSINLAPVNRNDNQIWLTSAQLAEALGYKQVDSVTKIYNRNSDEFSENMTATLEISRDGQFDRLGNLTTKTRIFSLRGCHLIAMFSRTKVAKDFRKWVLDILDDEVEKEPVINDNQQRQIQEAVNRRFHREGIHYQTTYHELKTKFKVPKYNKLPASKFNECMEWLNNGYYTTDKTKAVDSEMWRAIGLLTHQQLRQEINTMYQLAEQFNTVLERITDTTSQLYTPFEMMPRHTGIDNECVNIAIQKANNYMRNKKQNEHIRMRSFG